MERIGVEHLSVFGLPTGSGRPSKQLVRCWISWGK